jgi:DNA-binding CsgD family transcriptional regulator
VKKADLELLEVQWERLDNLYRTTGVLTELEQEIRSALVSSKKYKFHKGTAYYTFYLARLHEYNRQMNEASEMTLEAKKLAVKNKLESLVADCMASEANISFWYNKLNDAYTLASNAIQKAEQTGNEFAKTRSHFVLGSVYERFGSEVEALHNLQEALRISRQYKFLKLEGEIQDKLSIFFLSRHQNRYAEKYARAVLNIQHRLKNYSNIARAKIDLASILIEENKIDEAEDLLQQAESSEHILQTAEKVTLQLCYAKVFQYQKKYDEAKTIFLNTIEILIGLGRNILISNGYSLLCELQIETGDYQGALTSAKQALSYIKPGEHSYVETQANRLMYEASKLTGSVQDALNYLELYNKQVAKQEGKLLESRVQLIELEAEYQMKQAEITKERNESERLRIELLQKERELTTKTRHLIKQTESLAQFRDDLRAILRRSPENDPLIKDIKERLNQKPETQPEWQDFDREFQSVHPDFLQKLVNRHPILTKMEKKICSMLCIGLTSVDIAKLLSLSERNIENHRYRLRKKLALNTEKSLQEYLSSI